jgi:hypothetical protein
MRQRPVSARLQRCSVLENVVLILTLAGGVTWSHMLVLALFFLPTLISALPAHSLSPCPVIHYYTTVEITLVSIRCVPVGLFQKKRGVLVSESQQK